MVSEFWYSISQGLQVITDIMRKLGKSLALRLISHWPSHHFSSSFLFSSYNNSYCYLSFQIIGSSGMIYTLFHKINFCQCQSYKFQVLLYKANVTCKHVLAAALSYATGKFKVMELSSEDLTKLLIDSFVGRNEMQTSGHP